MDARRTGLSMVVVGAIAAVVGVTIDAVRTYNDAAARNDGIFDLSKLPHAVSFSGVMVAVLGGLTVLVGPALYAPALSTPGRRFAQGLAPLVAFASIAGAAAVVNTSRLAAPAATVVPAGASGTSASAATGSGVNGATAGTAADPHAEHAAHDHSDVLVGTATGDSPCEKALPVAASPGEVGAGAAGSNAEAADVHGARGMVKQVALTRAERVLLEQQLTAARTVVTKYPTVKSAEAAGYARSTPYVPCIGAHYTNTRLAARFDPAAPSELLYDGTTPDSKIVGLSYLVWHPGGPPEGFAGPNDHWHQHNANGGLCLKGGVVVGGETSTQAQCEALGGHKTVLTDIWMAHAWVVPGWDCSWGVFSGECPELGGKIGQSAWAQ